MYIRCRKMSSHGARRPPSRSLGFTYPSFFISRKKDPETCIKGNPERHACVLHKFSVASQHRAFQQRAKTTYKKMIFDINHPVKATEPSSVNFCVRVNLIGSGCPYTAEGEWRPKNWVPPPTHAARAQGYEVPSASRGQGLCLHAGSNLLLDRGSQPGCRAFSPETAQPGRALQMRIDIQPLNESIYPGGEQARTSLGPRISWG